MTESEEWVLVEGILEECWPGEWTVRTGKAYRLMLGEYEPGVVVAALRRIAKAGGRFRPSASEIMGALELDPGRPTWPEVLEALFGRRGILGHREEADCVAAAREFHPFIEAFAVTAGIRNLQLMGIYDEKYGQARQEMLRKEWVAFEEVAVERAARGVPLVTGGRTRELRGLQPLAALGLTRTKELGRG